MKKRILVLMVGFLFIGINGFAADGDVIVNGNVGIGTTTPGAKLDIQGGDLKLKGIKITHVTGTNPTCPSGTGAPIAKKFAATTCNGGCSSCILNAGWAPANWSCQYANMNDWNGQCTVYLTCVPTSWTEVICMGN